MSVYELIVDNLWDHKRFEKLCRMRRMSQPVLPFWFATQG